MTIPTVYLVWQEYQEQSRIVGEAKEKLRQLNAALLVMRKTCAHSFTAGACTICGQNEDAHRLLTGQTFDSAP